MMFLAHCIYHQPIGSCVLLICGVFCCSLFLLFPAAYLRVQISWLGLKIQFDFIWYHYEIDILTDIVIDSYAVVRNNTEVSYTRPPFPNAEL